MSWQRTDIPFARDDAQRVLPMMVICLVAFMGLLLSLAFSLFTSLGQQTRDARAVLQVEIPYQEKDAAARLKEVVKLLSRSEGVERTEVLQAEDMEALLAPWLGSGVSLEDLQLPTLIDVTTQMKGDMPAVNRAALQSQLQKVAPGATVEDRGPWLKQLSRGSAVLQWVLVVVALMLLACIAALVVLVARTSLKLHFQTVSLLHMFGATDSYIVQQFQNYHAWLTGKNAAIGAAAGGVVYALIGVATNVSSSPVMPHIALSGLHVVLLVALPVLTALVARYAARSTVQDMLESMH